MSLFEEKLLPDGAFLHAFDLLERMNRPVGLEGPPSRQVRRAHGLRQMKRLHRERVRDATKKALTAWRAEQRGSDECW